MKSAANSFQQSEKIMNSESVIYSSKRKDAIGALIYWIYPC